MGRNIRRLAFAKWMRRVGPSLLGSAPALRPAFALQAVGDGGAQVLQRVALCVESVEGHGTHRSGGGASAGDAALLGVEHVVHAGRVQRAQHGFARPPGRGVPVPAPQQADVDERADAVGVPEPALEFRLVVAPVGAELAASLGERRLVASRAARSRASTFCSETDAFSTENATGSSCWVSPMRCSL